MIQGKLTSNIADADIQSHFKRPVLATVPGVHLFYLLRGEVPLFERQGVLFLHQIVGSAAKVFAHVGDGLVLAKHVLLQIQIVYFTSKIFQNLILNDM